MKTIIRVRRKPYCNECFNKLPERVRKGRGAIPAGWVPKGTPQVKCCQCGELAFETKDG